MANERDDALAGRQDPERLHDEDAMDRDALSGPKTDWMSRSDHAAGDPVSEEEKRALNIIAQNDPRGDGAINGVSDPGEGDVPRSR